MTINDEEIDELALRVEQKIKETQSFLEGFPELESRSEKSKKLRRKIQRHNG